MKNRLWSGALWLAPGFSFGMALTLFLSRYTWLEMRFNTGLLWWITILIFIAIGLYHGKKPEALLLFIMDAVLLLIVIFAALKGGLSVLPAALFREGMAWDTLSLVSANWLITAVLFTSHLLYYFYGRKSKQTCGGKL